MIKAQILHLISLVLFNLFIYSLDWLKMIVIKVAIVSYTLYKYLYQYINIILVGF